MSRIPKSRKVDSVGEYAPRGTLVTFWVDPEKPWKKPSTARITRWVGHGVAEVRHLPTGDLYDIASHEFTRKRRA